jgi:hypothetical protein
MKLYILVFLENMLIKFKFLENPTGITATLHEDRYTFLIISRSALLRMRNVAEKSCGGHQNIRFVFRNVS